MSKLLKLLFVGAVALSLSTTVASANADKGQKLYSKKLKKLCGFTGAKMSAKYSQDEWESRKATLADEIKAACPKATDKQLKAKYLKHYFDFFYEFANDSGNVPNC
jgi:hypothetical protein